jgi:Flp pilus assembly pilin Flp|uniref:Flp family type IVb pilin n=1 Tax=Desulfobacca acetoxidans TaxID=60893 RepID=A0A7C3WHU4_9BACT
MDWHTFRKSEEGASSVEYGLLMAGIALAVIASILYLGQVVSTNFFKPAESLIR